MNNKKYGKGAIFGWFVFGVTLGLFFNFLNQFFTEQIRIDALQGSLKTSQNKLEFERETVGKLRGQIDILKSLPVMTECPSGDDESLQQLALKDAQIEELRTTLSDTESELRKFRSSAAQKDPNKDRLGNTPRGEPEVQSKYKSTIVVKKRGYNDFPLHGITASVGEISYSALTGGLVVDGAISFSGGREQFRDAEVGHEVPVGRYLIHIVGIDLYEVTFTLRQKI